MRLKFHPAWLFAALYVAYLALVAISQNHLPERLATHFNGVGQANGWSTRDEWRSASLLLGTALPLAGVGLFWIIRSFPTSTFNLPHRDHWLSAEQRPATFAYFLRHGWWLACLELFFLTGLYWAIVQANAASPPRLASAPLFAFTALFLAGIGAWIFQLRRRFAKPA